MEKDLDIKIRGHKEEVKSMEGTAQGDPTTMAIYTISIIPLVLMLLAEAKQVDNTIKSAAHADDLTAAGAILCLNVCRLGNVMQTGT